MKTTREVFRLAVMQVTLRNYYKHRERFVLCVAVVISVTAEGEHPHGSAQGVH
ncbi:MAG: hypothetical protein WAL52_17290 [Candidatus Sulfotelmatobacter sp.]